MNFFKILKNLILLHSFKVVLWVINAVLLINMIPKVTFVLFCSRKACHYLGLKSFLQFHVKWKLVTNCACGGGWKFSIFLTSAYGCFFWYTVVLLIAKYQKEYGKKKIKYLGRQGCCKNDSCWGMQNDHFHHFGYTTIGLRMQKKMLFSIFFPFIFFSRFDKMVEYIFPNFRVIRPRPCK